MNIKGYKKIYAIIGLVLYLCTYGSLVVSAQTLPDYTVLAPLPGTTKDCNQNDPNANCTTNFKTYLEGMFKLLIGVSAILAFVMLVYAGFLYTTSEGMGQTTNARSKIEDAIWGLILVIGAYAILNTINPKILEFNLSIKRPEIQTPSTGTGAERLSPDQVKKEKRVLDWLSATPNPIDINKGACIDRLVNCTNVVGLPQQTLTMLKDLKNGCTDTNTFGGCQVMITGGTESFPHVSHGPGVNAVDIAPNPTLNTYLGVTNPPKDKKTPQEKKIGLNTYIFTFEPKGIGNSTEDHWHVIPKP